MGHHELPVMMVTNNMYKQSDRTSKNAVEHQDGDQPEDSQYVRRDRESDKVRN